MNILIFVFIGFFAQLIDGTLGMGYGVICNSFLLGLGLPNITPLITSSSVHFAELFTTALSGIAHTKLGNIDKRLFKNLLVPGIIGGILGAYILCSINGQIIKPFIYVYLLLMGLKIVIKSFQQNKAKFKNASGKYINILAASGGFFDAIGGGGWGPIVTSSLVANNHHPRFTIGSVNTAEFFVTLAQSVTFIIVSGTIIFNYWQIILGLMIGGIVAAPLGALLCQKIPAKILMLLVGILIIFLSCRTLINFISL